MILNKHYLPALSLALLLPCLPVSIAAQEWEGGYNSSDAGLEDDQSDQQERVHTQHQLETLRRAVPPRYVRVLDYSQAPQTRRILVRGILFTYYGYRSRSVLLAGDFNNWQRIAMRRNRNGVYYYILPVREIEYGQRVDRYRYKFLVDNIWTADPTTRNREDDGLGGLVSVFLLDRVDVNRQATVRVLREQRSGDERLVEFAIYMPRARNISLVGNFNNWNPENDIMERGADGIFRLRLRLRPGGYLYKFVADGRWVLDTYNEDTRYQRDIGELASFLELR